ncbi:hypothetical protein R1sor_013546 [Riccia sorocarpa]|uniref:Uncharacterized protein n=1 Tax=Riccia sorocarpa TaxID=122646 RepID=A0ABD3H9T9_9MARC
MAPDKGQAEDKAKSDHISDDWWEKLGENDPEYTRILRKLRPEHKALLRRIDGKLTSDEKIATSGQSETLKEFNSWEFAYLHLEPQEWEVLLKSMNRNCQLEKIVWEVVPAVSSRHIGELVKGAGNLKTFEVWGFWDRWKFNKGGIAERYLLELAAIASSLEGHKHATLAKFVAGPVHDLTNDIVKIISSAPHLSDVELYGPCSMDETTKVVLCAALKECSDLKRVYLRNSSEGILEVLAKVYGQRFSDPQVSVLESLKLERPRGLAGLACLASSNISSLEIQLGNSGEHLCSLEEWQRVGRSLVRHPTLRVFKILIILDNRKEDITHSIQLGKELAELWKASRKSPLLDIRVRIQLGFFDKDVVFLQDALKDTYLKEILLFDMKISPQVFKSFAEMVGTNTSVRCLQLRRVKVDGAKLSPTVLEHSWGHFFHHLRENTSIKTLDLRESEGLNDEIFRDLMDLLQVNFILRDVKFVNTQWGRDGKSALVQAALERNAKLAGYFSVLGAAQLSFDGAKAGRVFLCGLPFAEFENTVKDLQREFQEVVELCPESSGQEGAVCMTPTALTQHVGNSDADCKKLAVVDLNWLTQNVLGQLITLGHPTESMEGAPVRRFRQVEVDADGLLNTQQLDDILHRVLSEQKDKEVIPMLKELLLELDLCYSLESGVGRTRYFFMPLLLGGESTCTTSEQVIYRPLSWEVKSPQGSSYLGYRIQCRDPKRTSLSPAFYPRYQIHLRKRMGATCGVKNENFTFGRYHVEIRVDGYCIFVETDVSSENHIDVLVQFCKPDSRDRIIDFTRRQIVQDLFEFCASEKGCPGVQLVVAVIRTKCVEDLTPKQLRSASQVVLVEDLKDIFKKKLKTCVESKVGLETPAFSVRKLNDLYERGCLDNLQVGQFLDALEFSCFHPWPKIGTPDASQFGLAPENVCAVDLLSSEEVREIVQTVWGDHKKFWPQGVLEVKGGPYQQLPGTSKVS